MTSKRRTIFELKEVSEQGTFEGLLSPYGIVDGGGDIVEPGAYTKTLKDQGPTRPMLWQHGSKDPIGLITLEERADGLWCKGQLLMEDDLAKRAYRFIKARIVKGLSIGFESVKDSLQAGVRHLNEIKLYEGSIVTFPMNESALITSVKSAIERKGDFNEELTEIQLCSAGYQMQSALGSALSSVVWSDMTREDKIAGVAVVLQQFTDAYTAYLPAYLDMLTETYGSMETWSKKRFETKEGRTISAATKEKLSTAHMHTKSASDILSALYADEADDLQPVTSQEKAAGEVKSEPVVIDHSAISELLSEAKESYRWN
jgi:HK97 family phage prohead protease